MTATTRIGAIADEAAAARQRSHVLREKWEESWLAEQRDITQVIRQPTRQEGVAAQATGSSARACVQELATQLLPGSRTEGESRMPPDTRAAKQVSDDERTASLVATGRTVARPQCAYPLQLFEQRTQSSAVMSGADRPARAPREPLPSCAFWRADGAIEAAMRLRDPDRTAEPVLAQLRHWLREGGQFLRRILINGRVAGAAAAGEPAQPQRTTHI